jgi:hypothetical protein
MEEDIIRALKEKENEDEHTKSGFLGSSERPWLIKSSKQEVGPGKYSIDTNDLFKRKTNNYKKNRKRENLSVFKNSLPKFNDILDNSDLHSINSSHLSDRKDLWEPNTDRILKMKERAKVFEKSMK